MTTLHETDRSNVSSLQLFFRLSRELLKISPVCVVLAILLAFLQGVLPSLSLLIMEWIMNNVQLSTVSVYQIVLLCALYIALLVVYSVVMYLLVWLLNNFVQPIAAISMNFLGWSIVYWVISVAIFLARLYFYGHNPAVVSRV